MAKSCVLVCSKMKVLYLYLGFMLLLVLVSDARAQKTNQTNNLPIMKMRIGQTCDYSVFHCILPPVPLIAMQE